MIQPKTKIQSALSRVSAHEYSYVNRWNVSDVQYPILNGAQTGSTLYLYGHRVYTYACTSTLCSINVYTHAFPGCSPMGVSRWIRACNAIHVCNVRFSTCSNRTRMKFIASVWQTFEIPDREKISFESEMKER